MSAQSASGSARPPAASPPINANYGALLIWAAAASADGASGEALPPLPRFETVSVPVLVPSRVEQTLAS